MRGDKNMNGSPIHDDVCSDYEEGSFDDIDYLPRQRKDAKHLLTCVKDITTDSYTIKLAEKVLHNVQSADDLLRKHDEKALEQDSLRVACIHKLEEELRLIDSFITDHFEEEKRRKQDD
jgi:hypothetical protein